MHPKVVLIVCNNGGQPEDATVDASSSNIVSIRRALCPGASSDGSRQCSNVFSIRYIENNVCTRVANCLCAHERVILVLISRVAQQRDK